MSIQGNIKNPLRIGLAALALAALPACGVSPGKVTVPVVEKVDLLSLIHI